MQFEIVRFYCRYSLAINRDHIVSPVTWPFGAGVKGTSSEKHETGKGGKQPLNWVVASAHREDDECHVNLSHDVNTRRTRVEAPT